MEDKGKIAYEQLLQGIQNYVEKCLADGGFDKTTTARIVEVYDDDEGYSISLNGQRYDNIQSIGGSCSLNEMINVLVPQGNYNNMVILKGGYGGSSGGGEGQVTSVNGRVGAVVINAVDVGLGNVGNFKAVSTVANQGLTDAEKQNAKDNLGIINTVVEIIDNLTSTDTDKALSAKQGKVLNDTKQDKITSTNKLSYNLLSNTPTIPSKVSQLENDSHFLTEDEFHKKISVPTTVALEIKTPNTSTTSTSCQYKYPTYRHPLLDVPSGIKINGTNVDLANLTMTDNGWSVKGIEGLDDTKTASITAIGKTQNSEDSYILFYLGTLIDEPTIELTFDTDIINTYERDLFFKLDKYNPTIIGNVKGQVGNITFGTKTAEDPSTQMNITYGSTNKNTGYETVVVGDMVNNVGRSSVIIGSNNENVGNNIVIHGSQNKITDNASSYTQVNGMSNIVTQTTYSDINGSANTLNNTTNSSVKGYYNNVDNLRYADINGMHLDATGTYKTVKGRYNESDTDDIYAIIYGNGTSNTERHNSFTITKDGKAWFENGVFIGEDKLDITNQIKNILLKDDDWNNSKSFSDYTNYLSSASYIYDAVEADGMVISDNWEDPINNIVTGSVNAGKWNYYMTPTYFECAETMATALKGKTIEFGAFVYEKDYTAPYYLMIQFVDGEGNSTWYKTQDLNVGSISGIANENTDGVSIMCTVPNDCAKISFELISTSWSAITTSGDFRIGKFYVIDVNEYPTFDRYGQHIQIQRCTTIPTSNLDGDTLYIDKTGKMVMTNSSKEPFELGGSGGGGSTYTAGDGIDITDDVISTETRIIDITNAQYNALTTEQKNDKSVYYNITDITFVPSGTDIVDNLTSTDTDKALSANQGKVLNDKIVSPQLYVTSTEENIVITKDDITVSLESKGDNIWFCKVPDLGTWTISSDNVSIDIDIDMVKIYRTELYSYGYQGWLNSANITKTFSSLDEVLEDENTLSILMTKHASVDYLVEWFEKDDTLSATILASDNALKWIGLKDYAYDNMPSSFITSWLASEKWEYALKDKVPTMTSATTPSGVVTSSSAYSGRNAWSVFCDGDGPDSSSSHPFAFTAKYGWITYKFVNPIKVQKFYFGNVDEPTVFPTGYTLQGSNDGVTYTDIQSFDNDMSAWSKNTFNVTSETNGYFLYIRVNIPSDKGCSNIYCNIRKLQFYGRSLTVSVPTMTSNNAPSGEVIYSSKLPSSNTTYYNPFNAFNGNASSTIDSNVWASDGTTQDGTNKDYIGYNFGFDVKVKTVVVDLSSAYSDSNYSEYDAILQGLNASNEWVNIEEVKCPKKNSATVVNVDNDNAYQKYRLMTTRCNIQSYRAYPCTALPYIQFYGVDYSENITLTIHSATNDTIYYYDNGTQTTLCTLSGTSGQATIPIDTLANGLTLYSSVAKDTTSGTNPYSQIIGLDSTDIYLMPDGAIYWYGNTDNCENLSSANGWSLPSSSYSSPTYSTHYVCGFNGGSYMIGIANKTPFEQGKYSKVKTFAHTPTSATDIGVLEATANKSSYGNEFDIPKSASPQIYSVNIGTDIIYGWVRGGGNRTANVYALWAE